MGIIVIVIFLALLLFSWPMIPGAIKQTDQDKRRDAYQKRIKEEKAKREQQKLDKE